MPGRHWKWRMHGGAITLAQQLEADISTTGRQPDLILATDMLDVATFKALVAKLSPCPIAVYFHENQITYPWSPNDTDVAKNRDRHYGFINFSTALTAEQLFFNSEFHRQAFLNALPEFLQGYPDHNLLETIPLIEAKSQTLHLGMDLNSEQAQQSLDSAKPASNNETPIILWNHRWEYDKNPKAFFESLFRIADQGFNFQLVVLGESYRYVLPIFEEAKERLAQKILHYGYAPSREEYHQWLSRCDILPVTSAHDFFGGSVVEAIAAGCIPLLPERLAYPEHVSPTEFPHLFYKSANEFEHRLSQWIKQWPKSESTGEIAAKMMRYDWKNIIRSYDDLFQSIISM